MNRDGGTGRAIRSSRRISRSKRRKPTAQSRIWKPAGRSHRRRSMTTVRYLDTLKPLQSVQLPDWNGIDATRGAAGIPTLRSVPSGSANCCGEEIEVWTAAEAQRPKYRQQPDNDSSNSAPNGTRNLSFIKRT